MHPALATALTRFATRGDRDHETVPPLYEAIDPEALESVLESPGTVTVRFEYAGYDVVIRSDAYEREMIDEGQ